MRDIAIREIIRRLLDVGTKLHEMKALDFFAREGDWQTCYYSKYVKQVYAWEIEPLFEKKLKENLPPTAKVTIGDSHILANNCSEKFDLIVLDNPQGCYGSYCEHFDALPLALHLLMNESIVIINVKYEPFDYENKLEWQKRRNEFYGTDASFLSDEFIDQFYTCYFKKQGYDVEHHFSVKRPQEKGLKACVFKLRKKTL